MTSRFLSKYKLIFNHNFYIYNYPKHFHCTNFLSNYFYIIFYFKIKKNWKYCFVFPLLKDNFEHFSFFFNHYIFSKYSSDICYNKKI